MLRRLRNLTLRRVPVRKRLGRAAAAALLVTGVSVTLASASSPKTNGSDMVAAQVTQPTLSPIQQMSLGVGEQRSGEGEQAVVTESVARVGKKVGPVRAFCHVPS